MTLDKRNRKNTGEAHIDGSTILTDFTERGLPKVISTIYMSKCKTEPHEHSGRYQICSGQTQLSSSTAEYNEEKQPGEQVVLKSALVIMRNRYNYSTSIAY